MCGIVGFIDKNVTRASTTGTRTLECMAALLTSRGPDDSGTWLNHKGVGLAHRRLAVVDTSSAGRQPMESPSGRFVIVFNGEIYNHRAIRAEIHRSSSMTKQAWAGSTDTETLLAAFDIWGIQPTIERCVGMFAFAVWDNVENILHLARDRLGEKPLYYGWQGEGASACFFFGSELKALREHECFLAQIDRNSLGLYTRFNFIPAPYSIYKNIFKLEPGRLLTISLTNSEPSIKTYWSAATAASLGVKNPLSGSCDVIADSLEDLLRSVISQQMIADVAVGAFLSGGIDSTTVVALMQSQSSMPVKTFTIGFTEADYNEADHSRKIAKHLGTEHTELILDPMKAADAVPLLPSIYCEPFADSSQIPTFLVSRLARTDVTVSLSGDGGDELFAGYSRHVFAQQYWNRFRRLPRGLRVGTASLLRGLSPDFINAALDPLNRVLPASRRIMHISQKVEKAAKTLSANSPLEFYLQLMTKWDEENLVVGTEGSYVPLNFGHASFLGAGSAEDIMFMDLIHYLPDDILVKLDRASMAVSLESRVPYLDHRIVEFAWRIPNEFKIHSGVGKWILRQVLNRYVPQELTQRPKAGFALPIADWLRGPLREWAESLLNEDKIKREGYLNAAPIRKRWSEHLASTRDWHESIWGILMFQEWLALYEKK